jgi:hypothetical protein
MANICAFYEALPDRMVGLCIETRRFDLIPGTFADCVHNNDSLSVALLTSSAVRLFHTLHGLEL